MLEEEAEVEGMVELFAAWCCGVSASGMLSRRWLVGGAGE